MHLLMTKSKPSPFGEWVKAERERRKWTQDQLAEYAGIEDRTKISLLETGKTKGNSAAMRESIAKAFGIPVEKLGKSTTAPSEDSPVFANLPWWRDVLKLAQSQFPKTPKWAFDAIGNLYGAEPPPPDPTTIGLMATAWYQGAAQRSAEIIAEVRAEMAKEDAEEQKKHH